MDDPDATWLRYKVAAILGWFGRLRAAEYVPLSWHRTRLFRASDGTMVLSVLYWKIKIKKWVTFYVCGDALIDLIMAYKKRTHRCHKGKGRIFWQERKGSVHGQHQGRPWFTTTLYKTMAQALGRQDWDRFSGHSMCRSAATQFARSGASLIDMKLWGNWKSDAVALSYIEEAEPIKLRHAGLIKLAGSKRRRPEDDVYSKCDRMSDEWQQNKRRRLDPNTNNRYVNLDDDDTHLDREVSGDDTHYGPPKKRKEKYEFNNCTVNF
eukprot:251584_1